TGQIVVMTYPLIGNYGVTPEDNESAVPQVAGFVVRELSALHTGWRARDSLESYLARHGVVGLTEVDTRAITRHVGEAGAMRAAIAPASVSRDEAMERILAHPRMEGLDLTCEVTTAERYEVPAVGTERFRVVAFDLGVKSSSVRLLA